jgi:hypothetical protein
VRTENLAAEKSNVSKQFSNKFPPGATPTRSATAKTIEGDISARLRFFDGAMFNVYFLACINRLSNLYCLGYRLSSHTITAGFVQGLEAAHFLARRLIF